MKINIIVIFSLLTIVICFKHDYIHWIQEMCSSKDIKLLKIYAASVEKSNRFIPSIKIFLKSFHEFCYVPISVRLLTINGNLTQAEFSNSSNYNIEHAWSKNISTMHKNYEMKFNKAYKKNIFTHGKIKIIITENIKVFEKLLDEEINLKLNSKDKFFIITGWDRFNDEKNLNNISQIYGILLKKMWINKKILNAMIFSLSREMRNLFFSYNPFVKISKNERGRVEILQHHNLTDVVNTLLNLNLHRVNNLGGYTLRVVVHESTNISDYDYLNKFINNSDTTISDTHFSNFFLDILKKRMNFIADTVSMFEFVQPFIVSSIGSSISYAFNTKSIDLSVFRLDTSNICDSIGKCLITPTIAVEYTRHCFVVPKAPHIPNWILIFKIFDKMTWTFTILTPIIIHMLWKLAFQNTNFLTVLTIMIGQPCKLPKSQSERTLIGTFFVANTIIIGAFTSSLYTSFTKKSFYKDIDTLDDLANSNLAISCPFYRDALVLKNDISVHQRLFQKLYFGKDDIDSVLYKIAHERNWATFIRKINYEFILYNFLKNDGSKQLHLVPECLGNIPFALALPRVSFLRDKIDEILIQINEAGLWDYKLSLLKNNIIFKQQKSWLEKTNYSSKRALSVCDMRLAFYIYIVGFFVSIITFLLEHLFSRLYRNRVYVV